MRVLDGAVAVFDAVSGVEPQSETVWRQADKYGVPRIVFINKMDRVGADFFHSIDSIVERLGGNPVALHVPMGVESNFNGMIDVVDMKAIIWHDEDGTHREVVDIPADFQGLADEWHHKMLDVVASEDEELLEKYLEGGDLEPDEIRRVIRKGTINRDFVPVLCGSAFKNKGVQPLLDGIVHYLPSPADLPAVQGFRPGAETQLEERSPSDDEPFSALAFKIMSDPYVGKLTYFRVTRGRRRRATPWSTPPPGRRSASAGCSACTPRPRRTSTR